MVLCFPLPLRCRSKAFALQAQGPEMDSFPEHIKMMFVVTHASGFIAGSWRQKDVLDLCSASLASFVSSRSVRDPMSKEKNGVPGENT